LFGHEKGAFTGAVGSRKGYFEEADGGTIFLDEVAELPLTTQARLLRVLESGEFIKVGSSTVQKTNIRVVAATNVDMAKAVEEGRFREDLYYRLSTVLITVPPLRDRGNDVILLARKFSSDFSERYRMPAITFSDSARQLLSSYRWPGNVRQLKNVVEQLSLFNAGEEIDRTSLEAYLPGHGAAYTPAIAREPEHSYPQERELLFNMIFRLQRELDELRNELDERRNAEPAIPRHATPTIDLRHEAPSFADEKPHSIIKYTPPQRSPFIMPDRIDDITAETVHPTTMTLEDTERETIRLSLERNSGRRKATAKELNISERTLYRKIKEYGLE
ncbi:MAG: sigma 54-interacting transcriptional regulator, partial [Muribaculaceae bacterium]|nr:sigma 54-interacting transcriptional regulator [Muribaculaceae bacterium]